jgi:hypothetical protein
MNKTKIPFVHAVLFLFSLLLLPIDDLMAQDYVLLHENLEGKKESPWILKNAKKTTTQSYKGEKSIEVAGTGSASYILDLPTGVEEIIVSGWMKLGGFVSKDEKDQTMDNNSSQGDTISLEMVEVSAQGNKAGASLSVEGFTIETGENSFPVRNGKVGFLNKNTTWTKFEKEIKIPAGVKKIKIICSNPVANSSAYFDEITIEKRQLGFVKEESSWAESVRLFKEKASRLIKNGDFEDGAQVWDPYWGFELSGAAHSGKYACMIQNKDSGAWRGSTSMKLFKIPAETKKLKVSAWIKAENVVGSRNSWETGAMLLTFTDDYGNEVPGGEAIGRTVGTHDWREFETYFTVSDRATNFKIALQLAGSTGKIYFDDIVATPMSEEEFYLVNVNLRNPGFENLLSGWPTFAGEATQEEAHSGEYSLKVAGQEAAWAMRQQTVSLVRNKKEFTFSVWVKTIQITETPNEWEGARVYIEFKDVNGIALNTESVGRAVGTTKWQKFTKKITVPEDAVEFTISCGRANVSGSAYFDDASLEY